MVRLSREQMSLPSLQSDQAFGDWYVDVWMAAEMPELCYRQDPAMLKEMTISARGYARRLGIDDVES